MHFTKDELELLDELVSHQLEALTSETKTLITLDHPNFLAGEKRYEEFLKTLKKKIHDAKSAKDQ